MQLSTSRVVTRVSVALQPFDEFRDKPAVPLEFETQAASRFQVVFSTLLQARH
jgi:hypothetical protein